MRKTCLWKSMKIFSNSFFFFLQINDRINENFSLIAVYSTSAISVRQLVLCIWPLPEFIWSLPVSVKLLKLFKEQIKSLNPFKTRRWSCRWNWVYRLTCISKEILILKKKFLTPDYRHTDFWDSSRKEKKKITGTKSPIYGQWIFVITSTNAEKFSKVWTEGFTP